MFFGDDEPPMHDDRHGGLGYRQAYGKLRAFVYPAFYLNIAAKLMNELSGQGQAYAGSSPLRHPRRNPLRGSRGAFPFGRAGGVWGLIKTAEEVGQVAFGNTWPGIFN